MKRGSHGSYILKQNTYTNTHPHLCTTLQEGAALCVNAAQAQASSCSLWPLCFALNVHVALSCSVKQTHRPAALKTSMTQTEQRLPRGCRLQPRNFFFFKGKVRFFQVLSLHPNTVEVIGIVLC